MWCANFKLRARETEGHVAWSYRHPINDTLGYYGRDPAIERRKWSWGDRIKTDYDNYHLKKASPFAYWRWRIFFSWWA